MYALFLFFNLVVAISASTIADFCKLNNKQHINVACDRKDVECDPDKKCGKVHDDELSDEERKIYLDIHNKYRQKIASGKDKRQPKTASNMNILGYSLEIEYNAQCQANTCKYGHLYNTGTPNYTIVGQNILWAKGVTKNKWVKDFEVAYLVWFEELAKYPHGSKFVFTQETAHYTLLMWSEVKMVGCGKIMYKNEVYIVCNYAPPGNMMGSPVFKEGGVCSACSDSKKCNADYPSLCGETYHFPVDPDFVTPFGELYSPGSGTPGGGHRPHVVGGKDAVDGVVPGVAAKVGINLITMMVPYLITYII